MPQDPNLYGQRAPKRQKKGTSLPSSLAFTAELSSLISSAKTTQAPSPSSSTANPTTTSARPRPSKARVDFFASVKAKKKTDTQDIAGDGGKLVLKESTGVTEDDKSTWRTARLNMEDKARLYAAMKRGDYVPKEGEAAPLVDFDRKWAETHDASGGAAASDSDSDEEDEEDDDNTDRELITFTDEFGRTRTGTRAEKARLERAVRARDYSAAELERMSARPKAPETLIYGDAVQAEAFRAQDEEKMEALARKRDRSLTPPEATHYDGTREIRTKGVGFFQFSKDEETRKKEMQSLTKEREETERGRKGKELEREARRREVEERRKLIEERRKARGEKRAAKMADNFLEGLANDFGS